MKKELMGRDVPVAGVAASAGNGSVGNKANEMFWKKMMDRPRMKEEPEKKPAIGRIDTEGQVKWIVGLIRPEMQNETLKVLKKNAAKMHKEDLYNLMQLMVPNRTCPAYHNPYEDYQRESVIAKKMEFERKCMIFAAEAFSGKELYYFARIARGEGTAVRLAFFDNMAKKLNIGHWKLFDKHDGVVEGTFTSNDDRRRKLAFFRELVSNPQAAARLSIWDERVTPMKLVLALQGDARVAAVLAGMDADTAENEGRDKRDAAVKAKNDGWYRKLLPAKKNQALVCAHVDAPVEVFSGKISVGNFRMATEGRKTLKQEFSEVAARMEKAEAPVGLPFIISPILAGIGIWLLPSWMGLDAIAAIVVGVTADKLLTKAWIGISGAAAAVFRNIAHRISDARLAWLSHQGGFGGAENV